jgi:dTDP-4-amino-4,6-dideoxy-D-galactose acyltransferase
MADVVVEALRLSLMSWETSLLGRKIGRVEGVDSTRDPARAAAALGAVEQDAVASGFTAIVARVDIDQSSAIGTLEASGFRLADIGATFEYKVDEGAPRVQVPAHPDVLIRKATIDDLPELREIVRGLFLHSYYYVSFSHDEADLLFATWITNCVSRERADEVFVAGLGGRIMGFVTCRLTGHHVGVIDLIGVRRQDGQRGIGKILIQSALTYFREADAIVVTVRTQVSNRAAVNLYLATGSRLAGADATLMKPLST